MNERTIDFIEKIIMALLILLLTLSMWKHENAMKNRGEETIHTDTVFNERIDTVTLEHTVTRYKPTATRVDTIYQTDTISNEAERHISKVYEESGSYQDTTCIPSASVDYSLMIRTRDYDVDSIGLSFKVDYPKVTETKTITNTVYRKRHLTHGIQLGVGYGIVNKRPDVFVGYGFQYNF